MSEGGEAIPGDRVHPAKAEEQPRFSMAYMRQRPECVVLLNPEGRISFINERGMDALELTSLSRNEGAPFRALWPEDAAPMIELAVERARDGEPVRFEVARPGADAVSHWWDVTLTPVTNAEGRVETLFAVIRPTGAR